MIDQILLVSGDCNKKPFKQWVEFQFYCFDNRITKLCNGNCLFKNIFVQHEYIWRTTLSVNVWHFTATSMFYFVWIVLQNITMVATFYILRAARIKKKGGKFLFTALIQHHNRLRSRHNEVRSHLVDYIRIVLGNLSTFSLFYQMIHIAFVPF